MLGLARAAQAWICSASSGHCGQTQVKHPYCRGKHHLEEILWRENVSRADLDAVLEEYADVLVTVQHE